MCSWPSTARRRRRGCGGRPTDAEPRRSPPAQPSTGRSSSKLTGADRATRARSIEAELGGDVGDGRRCRRNPAVRRWSTTSRSRSARERRRISPELAEAGRGTRRRRESLERVGLGFRPRERESEGGRLSRAEPVRSSHLGGLTGGPGLSVHFFYFLLIVLSQKPLRKTLICLNINQKKKTKK
jgi:hypothetical protein